MPFYLSNEESENLKYSELLRRWVTNEDVRQYERKKYLEMKKLT
jgi:hypothetical protein